LLIGVLSSAAGWFRSSSGLHLGAVEAGFRRVGALKAQQIRSIFRAGWRSDHYWWLTVGKFRAASPRRRNPESSTGADCLLTPLIVSKLFPDYLPTVS